MNNYLNTLLILVIIAAAGLKASSATLNDDRLATEGTRIGRIYHLAVLSGDADMQNHAIKEFNTLLSGLRTQGQADILTKAFNNANIVLKNPYDDAQAYTRTFMDAYSANDSTAMTDAIDLANAVKRFYESERSADDAATFNRLHSAAREAAILGHGMRECHDSSCADFANKAAMLRQELANDSLALGIFNYNYDYYSIRLTTPEEDASKYADVINKATASGSQSNVDAAARIIGMIYQRYFLEKGKDEATRFNSRINQLIGIR